MSGFSSDAYRDLPRMLAITESGQTAGTVCGCERRGKGRVRGRVKERREKGGRRGREGKEGKGRKEERNRTEREKVRKGNWTGEDQKKSGNRS